MQRRGRPLFLSLTIVLAATLGLSSCVLTEGPEYVVQPAPPGGLHVTIKAGPTALLHIVSDMITRNDRVDHLLRAADVSTRCDSSRGTRARGNRCVYSILQDMEMRGNLIATALGRLVWGEATKDSEFADFANDAMAPTLARRNSCLHVTVREYGDWPVTWWNTNWTYRTSSDSKCR